MKIAAIPMPIVDQEGKKEIRIMMAWVPVANGIIDTSSSYLSKPLIYYDNCKGVAYIRIVGTEKTMIVRTGVLEVGHTVADIERTYSK
jgi:hypothetical protein